MDDVVGCKSKTTIGSKTVFLEKNYQKYTPSTETTGYLSRRIAVNLKSSTNFYVRPDNLSGEIYKSCEEKTVPMIIDCNVLQTKSDDRHSIASFSRIMPRSWNGKTGLDKYFRASKSLRRLPYSKQNTNRIFTVAAESDPKKILSCVGGNKRLDTEDGQSRIQPQQQTMISENEELLTRNISSRKFQQQKHLCINLHINIQGHRDNRIENLILEISHQQYLDFTVM